MTQTKLDYLLTATDKASPVFGKVGKSASGLNRTLGGLGKAAGALAGVFAVTKVVQFGKDLLSAAEDGIATQAAMDKVAESMGIFGKETANVTDRLSKLADKQALATGIDDDAIRATQTKLLTFKEVAKSADTMGGNFDRATTAALDLAKAGFGTAESNAVQLGKALNDPIKGITALAKSGVTFTESEKEKIAALVESGKMAEAQNVILKALETQVGGTAAASATASDKMAVKWGQVQGTLGELLLPAFNAVSDFVLNKILPAVEKFAGFIDSTVIPAIQVFWGALTGGSEVGEFDGALGRINDAGVKLNEWITIAADFVQARVLPAFSAFGGYLTGTVIPAVTSIAQWIVRNRDWLAALAIAIGTAVAVWKAFTTAMAVWKAATAAAAAIQVAFNLVLAANPIGLIITAIAALVAGLVWFFTKTETGRKIWAGFTDFLGRAWERIKLAFSIGWNAIKKYLGMAWDFIKKVWSFSPLGLIVTNWDKIVGFIQGLPGKIKSAASGMWDGITDAFKNALNWVIDKWNNFGITLGGGKILGIDIPTITLSTPNIPRFFTGGTHSGGLARVGEYGPETVMLPRGSRVLPTGMASNRAGGGGGAARFDDDQFDRLVAAILTGAKRIAQGETASLGRSASMGVA